MRVLAGPSRTTRTTRRSSSSLHVVPWALDRERRIDPEFARMLDTAKGKIDKQYEKSKTTPPKDYEITTSAASARR